MASRPNLDPIFLSLLQCGLQPSSEFRAGEDPSLALVRSLADLNLATRHDMAVEEEFLIPSNLLDDPSSPGAFVSIKNSSNSATSKQDLQMSSNLSTARGVMTKAYPSASFSSITAANLSAGNDNFLITAEVHRDGAASVVTTNAAEVLVEGGEGLENPKPYKKTHRGCRAGKKEQARRARKAAAEAAEAAAAAKGAQQASQIATAPHAPKNSGNNYFTGGKSQFQQTCGHNNGNSKGYNNIAQQTPHHWQQARPRPGNSCRC